MKKSLRYIGIISVVFGCLIGCATTAGYKKILDTWIGASESNLIGAWGVPTNSYQSGSVKYLSYSTGRTVNIPGTQPTYTTICTYGFCTSSPSGGSSGYTLNFNCETTFQISGGRIISYSFRGNDCTANE